MDPGVHHERERCRVHPLLDRRERLRSPRWGRHRGGAADLGGPDPPRRDYLLAPFRWDVTPPHHVNQGSCTLSQAQPKQVSNVLTCPDVRNVSPPCPRPASWSSSVRPSTSPADRHRWPSGQLARSVQPGTAESQRHSQLARGLGCAQNPVTNASGSHRHSQVPWTSWSVEAPLCPQGLAWRPSPKQERRCHADTNSGLTQIRSVTTLTEDLRPFPSTVSGSRFT